MNSKQESAMNISERDIEDAFIQQEDATVERELAEGDDWVNGDACRYYNKQLQDGGNLIYVSQHPIHSDHSVVFASEEVVPFFTVPTAMLSRPLTPEQKAAKERELAAIELHDKANAIYFGGELPSNCSWDAAMDNVKAMWLAVVDMTGYRKCQ